MRDERVNCWGNLDCLLISKQQEVFQKHKGCCRLESYLTAESAVLRTGVECFGFLGRLTSRTRKHFYVVL